MMKLAALQQNRRSNSFRGSSLLDSADGGASAVKSSPAAVFWVVLHCLCCLISLVLGFRFSRLLFFLFFSVQYPTTPFRSASDPQALALLRSSPLSNLDAGMNGTVGSGSRVVVGRHGILIRPWPHPNPTEVMAAHRIIERVQREQRAQYGVKSPRTVIAITPTYVRTFQALHLTGVMHSLMNVPYDLVWIVVEAGGTTNETAELLEKSGLRTIHVGFKEKMPVAWEERHKLESRMRLDALRTVRKQKLDGIVVFADDSNMHSMEFFDEVQKVKWMAAAYIGVLAHSGGSEEESSVVIQGVDERKAQMPVQGPACNSSNHLVGWHNFDSTPYVERSAKFIGDRGFVLPKKIEWAGFVLNSRLVWDDAEEKPDWVKDFDGVAEDAESIESPLALLKDPSFVEPLGSCGRKVMLWWLRVEARADSKFPSRWIIDPPLDVTVPAKRTPWPDAPPELPSGEKTVVIQQNTEKRPTKTKSPRKRSSRSKRKRAPKNVDDRVTARRSGEK